MMAFAGYDLRPNAAAAQAAAQRRDDALPPAADGTADLHQTSRVLPEDESQGCLLRGVQTLLGAAAAILALSLAPLLVAGKSYVHTFGRLRQLLGRQKSVMI